MYEVLTLLDGWLQPDVPMPIDGYTPKKTYALYDYKEMSASDKMGKKQAAWHAALARSLQNDEYERAQIALLYRSPDFLTHVLPRLQEALMGADQGESPQVTITPVQVPPLLSSPLDPKGLDPQIAAQLDVIAFCRIQTNDPKFHYALAVRLSADGEVRVMLPEGDRWLKYDEASHRVGQLLSDARAQIAGWNTPLVLNMDKTGLRAFAEHVLTQKFERPTLAVIEAEKWRDGTGKDKNTHGWTQLRNDDLSGMLDELRFPPFTTYQRSADKLHNLLAVVRVRMNGETPQYVSADDFASEDEIRDIPHLTGYVDAQPGKPFHYFSVAGLSEMQEGQDTPIMREAFRGDMKEKDIAFKHAQLVEIMPFFVRQDLQSDEGRTQLCRCLPYLRISPGFVMGDILLPFPKHLGEALIKDQLCIINAEE